MALMIQSGRDLIRINQGNNRIEYSSDNGRNWHTRHMGSSVGIFYDLCYYGSEILACTSKGVYYSKDDGRNWHSRYIGNSAGTFQQIMNNGTELIAMTSKGQYYSKDQGRNWHRR